MGICPPFKHSLSLLCSPPTLPPGFTANPRTSTYIFFQGIQNEGLELPQALIDPGAAPLLHDRLGGLERREETRGMSTLAPIPHFTAPHVHARIHRLASCCPRPTNAPHHTLPAYHSPPPITFAHPPPRAILRSPGELPGASPLHANPPDTPVSAALQGTARRCPVAPSRVHPPPKQSPLLHPSEEVPFTLRCSLALLGLSGVWLELAGAPAMGEAVGFSMVSAGIFVFWFLVALFKPGDSKHKNLCPMGSGLLVFLLSPNCILWIQPSAGAWLCNAPAHATPGGRLLACLLPRPAAAGAGTAPAAGAARTPLAFIAGGCSQFV